MEPKITVKTQSLPERCDICHQIDLFDPLTGDCARCKEAKAIAIQSDMSLAATLKSYVPMFAMPVASGWKRFANLFIDTIVGGVLSLCVLTLILLLFPSIAHNFLIRWLIGTIFNFLYYFLFEAIYQKTPGKFITSTKVVNLVGEKPTRQSIALRTLARFVPFEVFSRSENTWGHDRWTDTRVVNDR